MTLAATAASIRACVDRLRRLMPMRIDPEAFHVERDDLCHEMMAIADRLEPHAARKNERHERGRFQPGVIRLKGREIKVEVRTSRSI